MPVNSYFQNGIAVGDTNEHDLIQDMTDELIQMAGHDIAYIPKTNIKDDIIFGEDVFAKFEKHYMIEMYFNNVTDWGGNQDLISKFGLIVDNTADFVVSRKRFTDVTGMLEPREGDILYFPLTKALLKIDHVEFENPFYQAGKLYTYTLKCSFFPYSHEEFSTGITAVDNDLQPDVFDPLFGDNVELNIESEEVIDSSEPYPFGDFIEE